MNRKFEQLFNVVKLQKGIHIRNRIVMAPMTTWASNPDGTVSNEELEYYKLRVNGVGLIITGCTPVMENGIGFEDEFLAYDDRFISSLSKLASTLKAGGAPAILQIFHAGNKALTHLIPDGELVSASAIETQSSMFAKGATPRELKHEEIIEIIHAFGETTRRAIEAGFDGVELHGAHGFLLQNFESPYFNKRNDQWGGTLENRLKFPLAVVEEVQKIIERKTSKPFLLGYRFSPDEPMEGALRIEDTLELIERLIENKVDYLHGSLVDALIAKPINMPNSRTILELVVEKINGRVPLVVAGNIKSPDTAVSVIEKGATFVALGQAIVMDPEYVEKLEHGKENDILVSLFKSLKEKLSIPEKLMNVAINSKGWFKIED